MENRIDPQNRIELEKIGLTYRGDELEAMTEEEYHAGLFKFNIPAPQTPDRMNGEGIFAWADPESKKLYEDNDYYGKLTVILCNEPWTYANILRLGAEVVIRCNGHLRPILDPDWVKEKLFDTGLVNVEEKAS